MQGLIASDQDLCVSDRVVMKGIVGNIVLRVANVLFQLVLGPFKVGNEEGVIACTCYLGEGADEADTSLFSSIWYLR